LLNAAVVGGIIVMSEWSMDQCIHVSMNTGTLWLGCALASTQSQSVLELWKIIFSWAHILLSVY
jgi:hypothetical protein